MKRRQALAACAAFGLTSVGALAMARRISNVNRALRGVQTVRLETDPSEAKVVFVPLNEIDGRPMPSKRIVAGALSPVTQELEPGMYLVIAQSSDGRFHEVMRTVPHNPKVGAGSFNHRHWTLLPTGVVKLPTIRMPNADIAQSMVLVQMPTRRDGSVLFSEDDADWSDRAPIYMDELEFTYGCYRAEIVPGLQRERQSKAQPDHEPMRVDFDRAAWYAELTGARLPSEDEYALAARYNAAVQMMQDPDATSHVGAEFTSNVRVGNAHTSDRLVRRIYADPPEWTSSVGIAVMAGPAPLAGARAESSPAAQIIWGATQPSDLNGIDAASAETNPRVAVFPDALSGKFGFRRARSVRARFLD